MRISDWSSDVCSSDLADAHVAALADGRTIRYGKLIWAAGGSPRRLSCAGNDLKRVHAVRTRADVDQLMSELPTIERGVAVGGGYSGSEGAAVTAQSGPQQIVL